MKTMLTILALLIIGFVVLFVLENTEIVELGLFGNKVKLPISFVAIGFYVVGAFSGASMLKIIKKGLKKEEE